MADMGTYRGAGSSGVAGIKITEAWLGAALPRALDFIQFTTWDNTKPNSPQSLAQWAVGEWGKQSRRMTFGVPLVPYGIPENTWVAVQQEVADGKHDDAFKTIGKILVAKGFPDAIIRLAWEFNGGWYPHYAGKAPSIWLAAFQQAVRALRSVPGQAFKIDWNPSIGQLGVKPDSVYPGDDYVDVIGLDVYNQWWTAVDQADPGRRWNTLLTQGYGLSWHANFAKQHGKPMSFPEWGTGNYTNKPNGGGDDPLFIANMGSWIQSHDVLYHNYWDYDAPDYHARVSAGQLPLSGGALRAWYLAGRPAIDPVPDSPPADPDMIELEQLRIQLPALQTQLSEARDAALDLQDRLGAQINKLSSVYTAWDALSAAKLSVANATNRVVAAEANVRAAMANR